MLQRVLCVLGRGQNGAPVNRGLSMAVMFRVTIRSQQDDEVIEFDRTQPVVLKFRLKMQA